MHFSSKVLDSSVSEAEEFDIKTIKQHLEFRLCVRERLPHFFVNLIKRYSYIIIC